jgi:hypothetical protein
VILVTILTLGGCAWTLVALLGTAAGFADALRQHRAEQFPATTGRVIASYVEEDSHQNKDRTKPPHVFYRPIIRYQYEVGGKIYREGCCRFGRNNSDSDPGPARRLVAEFPVGREMPVYYDPDQPENAVLKPGIVGRDLFLFPPLIFVAVGMIALRGFAWMWWRDNFIRPDTGGVCVRFEETCVRARLPRFSPLICGLVVAALLSIAATLFLDGGPVHPMTLRNVAYAWAIVIAVPILVFIALWLRLASGREDLVIDRDAGTITLPRNFGRWQTITFGMDRIISADLLESGQGRRYRCHPTLFFHDPEPKSARLGNWADSRKGRAFIEWLRNQIWKMKHNVYSP